MDICKKLIDEREAEIKFQDRRLIETDKAMEAMKVANKQWESAVSFLVYSYWTKAQILEIQGKLDESAKSYEQLINYFTSKMGSEVKS